MLFYEKFFRETTGLSWEDVCHTASKFLPLLQRDWHGYVEELDGMYLRNLHSLYLGSVYSMFNIYNLLSCAI